jgi:hypothetical protein
MNETFVIGSIVLALVEVAIYGKRIWAYHQKRQAEHKAR